MNGAIYLFQNSWGWLLVALILGLFVGWMSWSGRSRQGWFAGWAKWGAVAFVVAAAAALLKLFPGRWGLWVETALWFSAVYIAGCFLGGWLRAALGIEASTTPVKAAVGIAAVGAPSVEIFGHDTGASYPGVRPPWLAAPKGKADDLRQISGMGPLNEKFCNEIGVHHYSQIAGWNADNARWFDYHLGRPGFVGQMNWIEQAGALAQGKGVGAIAGGVGVMAAGAAAGDALRGAPATAAHGVALADAEASKRAAAARKIENERHEAIRLGANKAEADRAEFLRRAAAKAEVDRAEAIRLAAVRAEAERAEAARQAAAAEAARQVAAKAEADRAEAARLATVKAEAERIEAARLATLKAEAERSEAARLAAVKAEAERVEAARVAAAEAARLAAAKAEAERVEAGRTAATAEAARVVAAKAEADRAEAARIASVKAEADRAEAARLSAVKAEAERVDAARTAAAETARLAAAKAEAERAEAARIAAAEAARLAAAKAEAERAEAARLEAVKAEAERAEAARRAAAAETARLAAAKAEEERAEAARRAAAEAAAKAEAARAAAAAHPGARPAALALMGADKGDDLKWIKGIGPKNEKICNELGVYRFRQIADWTPENATWVGHHVKFPGRIEREHWIPQARLLAAGLDTDHSVAVKSGRIAMDDSADAPLSEAAAAAFLKDLPQVAPKVEGEDTHAGSRPVGLLGPRGGKADNLKLISGIGKQNEARLHGLGIWHFDQIAAWTVENIKWAGSYLAFPGRIDREQWVAQAKDLAAGRQTEFAKRAAAGLVKTSADDGSLGQGNVAVVPPKS